ncbi:MAG: hypothetical protein KBC64_00705 [Simkaniaceae bacterium]|nr:hypothetical protein [Simkaniaceae bacterium]
MSFDDFEKKFTSAAHSEGRIEVALEFMRTLLSDGENTRMQEFWEAKNRCVEAFKQSISPVKRKTLWSNYVELTDEAKQLKLILDDRANFAIEQIDIALDAIEKDIQESNVFPIDLSFPSSFFVEEECRSLQGEISLLHMLGCRLNALRMEAIETEMRFKHRNRLLKRISLLGDIVFPRKKELIKTLSELFLKEVQRFVNETSFSRNDIVLCQTLQKELTINPSTFKQVRVILAEAWNKERKPKVEAPSPPPKPKVEFDLSSEVNALLHKADQGDEVEEELRDLRVKVKRRIEQYRKEIGGSNFDFEKAINMQLLIESARKYLQMIEARL